MDTSSYERIRFELNTLRQIKRVDSSIIYTFDRQINTKDLIIQVQKAEINELATQHQNDQKQLHSSKIEKGVYKFLIPVFMIIGYLIGK